MGERTWELFFEADRSENISKAGEKRCVSEYELDQNHGYTKKQLCNNSP